MKIKFIILLLLIPMLLMSSCVENVATVQEAAMIKGETIYPNSKVIRSRSLDDYKDVFEKYLCYAYFLPDDGYVPDESTAVQIAEMVFERIYGNDIDDERPFVAEYDKEYDVWYVHGTNRGGFGGSAYAIIQRMDAKILAVSHS